MKTGKSPKTLPAHTQETHALFCAVLFVCIIDLILFLLIRNTGSLVYLFTRNEQFTEIFGQWKNAGIVFSFPIFLLSIFIFLVLLTISGKTKVRGLKILTVIGIVFCFPGVLLLSFLFTEINSIPVQTVLKIVTEILKSGVI